MNPRLIVLLLVVTVLYTNTYAQPPETTDRAERAKVIKLATKELPSDYKFPIAVTGIQIMNHCWDTSRLGYVQVGLMNKKINAVSAKPLQLFLQDYLNEQYHPIFKDAGSALLWVIEDLRISERTFAMNEKAYIRLKANAYLSADKEHYQPLLTFDTILIRSGMDVTGKHDQQIADAIHLLLDACGAKAGAGFAPDAPSLTLAALIQQEEQQWNQPIMQATAYKNGVYASYREFLDNAPSISEFDLKITKKKVTVYATPSGGAGTLINDPWGVCKDGELYKYTASGLIPLDKSGRGFVVSQYLEAINRKNKAIFWSAVSAGAAGGLIGGAAAGAAAANSSKVYFVTAVPYIKKQQPEATAIDMTNGELTF